MRPGSEKETSVYWFLATLYYLCCLTVHSELPCRRSQLLRPRPCGPNTTPILAYNALSLLDCQSDHGLTRTRTTVIACITVHSPSQYLAITYMIMMYNPIPVSTMQSLHDHTFVYKASFNSKIRFTSGLANSLRPTEIILVYSMYVLYMCTILNAHIKQIIM